MGESFGSMLRRHRLAAGLTQEALAERASLSATAVAALERGRNRAPRLSTLRELARALDLTREQLAALSEARNLGAVSTPGPSEPVDAAPGEPPAVAGPARAAARLPPPAGRRWRTRFVGRSAELDRLLLAWAARHRLVQVTGESGIGKTRLVSELAARAGADATVAWGRCNQDRIGSYLPFVEILRRLVADAAPDALRAAVGGQGELLRLLPELSGLVGALPVPTRAEAGSEERLLFDAVASLLRPWLPMLMVIDDLHWADEATMALLRYLVADERLDGLVVLVTARPGELTAERIGTLAEMARELAPERVQLVGLGGEDLAALVSDLIGSAARAGLVESVAAATEGNPFLAEELTLHLVDSGLLVDDASGASLRGDAVDAVVPERVRQTTTKRLQLLSPEAIALLSVGAVVGREFDLWVAAAASGLAGAALVDAVDDGLLSGLIVEFGPGHLAFSHALVRDAVVAGLSLTRQASLHRQVAETMATRSDPGPSFAAEMARHWAAVAASDPMAAETAATWAVRAGDAALVSAAAEEAIAMYERASELWAPGSVGQVDALVRLGFALRHSGRADDADERFRQAGGLAVALGDTALQARAAIGLGRRYAYWETDASRIAALEAALAATPPVDRLLRVGLMGLLVTHLINGLEPEQARRRDELADSLSAVAGSVVDDADLTMAVGGTRIYDCIDDPAALGAVAGRIVDVATTRGDLRVEVGARFALVLSTFDRADVDGLASAVARHGDNARRLADPSELSQDARVRSTVAFVQGRYEEAEALADEALRLGQASGDFNAELLHFAQGLLRAVDQGLAPDVLPLLLAATDYQHIASFDAGTALCAALGGDPARAMTSLDRYLAVGLGSSPRGADWVAPTAFLAHACCLLDAAPVAGPLHQALSRAPADVVRVGPVAGWWGPVDHHLGGLAALAGRTEEAERRLRRALEIELRLGARPFEARTRAALAEVLRRSDPDAAADMAARAAATAEALGAAGVTAEVHASLARTG